MRIAKGLATIVGASVVAKTLTLTPRLADLAVQKSVYPHMDRIKEYTGLVGEFISKKGVEYGVYALAGIGAYLLANKTLNFLYKEEGEIEAESEGLERTISSSLEEEGDKNLYEISDEEQR